MCEYPNRPAGDSPITLRAISALRLDLSHSENICFWQNQHSPHEIVNGTTTRSPFFRFLTSLPTSTTSPIGSWPTMSPGSIVGMKSS